MPQIAVLTGDIVNSSALSANELDQAIGALRHATHAFSDWQSDGTPTPTVFARRGGDGWQTLLTYAHLSLRASLFLRASLMAEGPYQTRISIAVGEGSLSAEAVNDLNAGHGPAFIRSGRQLDQLTKNSLMQHADGGTLSAAVLLADHISQEWTQAQASAMSLALEPSRSTQQAMAVRLGISRQAVAQSLKSAGYAAISAALDLIEADLSERHPHA